VKKIKVIIFLMLFLIVLKINASEFEPKKGQVLVGYDLYDGYINPNDLITSALNYYIETEDSETFKIYKYQDIDNWLSYDDSERKFVSLEKPDINNLELKRYLK